MAAADFPADAAWSDDVDPRRLLSDFFSQYCGRPLSNQDIGYSSQQYGDMFQATVKLNCLEGKDCDEFTGELCATVVEAEMSAAELVLRVYPDQNALPPPRHDVDGFTDPREALANLLQEWAGRPLEELDIIYGVDEADGEFVATVQLDPSLGVDLTTFTGERFADAEDAERNAAQQALDALAPPSPFEEAAEAAEAAAAAAAWRPSAKDGLLRPKAKTQARPASRWSPAAETGGFAGWQVAPFAGRAWEQAVAEAVAWEVAAAEMAVGQSLASGTSSSSSALALIGTTAQAEAPPNPKADVAQFFQRYCGRTLTKDDLIYTVKRHGLQYQATLTINCLKEGDPMEFAGELKLKAKAAEMSAAEQFLQAFPEEVARFAAATSKRPKGKSVPAGDPANVPDDGKSQLNIFLQRYIGRPVSKPDVLYATRRQAAGFCCQITLVCLSERHPDRFKFDSDWSSSIKAAEMSAAQKALEAFASERSAVLQAPKGAKAPGAAAGAAKAAQGAAANPIAELAALVAERAGRPAQETDLGFKVQQHGQLFQATVHLVALASQGVEAFTGELRGSLSEARVSAAHHALCSLRGTTPGGPIGGGFNAKSDLSAFLQRLLGRPVTREDVTYDTRKQGNLHVSTLKLHCLRPPEEFVGEPHRDAKSAEKSAAEKALQAHAAQVIATAEAPKKRKAWEGPNNYFSHAARYDPAKRFRPGPYGRQSGFR